MSYVFYPGCSLDSTARDYALSTHAVAGALGLELPELQGWTCCGSTPAHQSSRLLALALPAANLESARGNTVAVACAACFNRLKTANHAIRNDPASRAAVAEALGRPYDGSTPVKHLLEIVGRDLGPRIVAARTVRPLRGLRVAAYYGCLLVRPPDVMKFDDPEHPRLLDGLLAAAGAEPVSWTHRIECCGGSASITDVETVLALSREILAAARDARADAIATACGMCQLNLDLRQADIEARSGESFRLPVFYFTQLLGLAFGLRPDELGLRSLVVDPGPLLEEKGIGPGVVAGTAPGREPHP
jgi:heterodisulfide reductase subunit B